MRNTFFEEQLIGCSSYKTICSLRDKFGVIFILLLAGPLLVGPLLVGPLLVGPLLVGPLLVGPLLVGPLLVGPLLVGPLFFSYIQDHFCCSLRDKFGVIVSLLRFLLIYKTKWSSSPQHFGCQFFLIYKTKCVRNRQNFGCQFFSLYTRLSELGPVFTPYLYKNVEATLFVSKFISAWQSVFFVSLL